jgi:uncharacterized membrane protein
MNRLEAFNDGVIIIAITVLERKVPHSAVFARCSRCGPSS